MMTKEKETLITLQLCPSVAPQLQESFILACTILVKVSAYSHTWFYIVIVIRLSVHILTTYPTPLAQGKYKR